MQEVFRSPKILAFASVKSDDVLVVGFSFHLKPSEGFGQLGRLNDEHGFGFSILDVACTMSFPYPVDEVQAALTAIGEFAKGFRRVISFGASLGGFAAINFASYFGVQVAIAASPPFTLDPEKMPEETRWGRYRRTVTAYPWDDIAKSLATLREVYVLYDPTGPDDVHVASIEKIARRTILLPIPFGGHPTTRVLSEGKTLGRIMTAIVEDRLNLVDFRQAVRESRPISPWYHRNLAAAQPPSRDALRVRLLDKALRLCPTIETFLEMLPPLARLDRLTQASSLAQPLAEMEKNNAAQMRLLNKENSRRIRQVESLKHELIEARAKE